MKRIMQLFFIGLTLILGYWASFPLWADIHLSLGNAYAEKGLPFIAIDHYNKGMLYGSTNYDLYHRLGNLCVEMVKRREQNDFLVTDIDKCISIFNRGADITGSPFLDEDLGRAYLFRGDRDRAGYYLSRAYEKSEGNLGSP